MDGGADYWSLTENRVAYRGVRCDAFIKSEKRCSVDLFSLDSSIIRRATANECGHQRYPAPSVRCTSMFDATDWLTIMKGHYS